jgi:uncharacterized GH25 family protein
MKTILSRITISMNFLLFSGFSFAHYPILSCSVINQDSQEQVVCEASFSNRATAPGVIMEIFSEDDEVISSGVTDNNSLYQFPLPEGDFFILMDAGPGHVLEISNDEVTPL